MLLYYNNYFDSATLTPSTDSEDPAFPATNAQQEHLGRRWKSMGINTTDVLVMDLGSAKSVGACIIGGHNLGDIAAGTIAYLDGDDNSGFSSPEEVATIDTVPTGTSPLAFDFANGAKTYRYWRLRIFKTDGSEVLSIGRIFLGPVVDTTERGSPDFEGFSQTHQDLSKVQKALGGERYANQRSRYRDLNLRISYVPEAIQALLRALDAAVGIHTPFWLQIHTTSPLNDYLYVAQTKPLSEAVVAWDSAPIWNTALNLEELI